MNGLLPILFLIFLTLKLMGYIDWSWWWISSPLMASVILVFGYFMYFVFKEITREEETNEQKAARRLRELAQGIRRKR